MSTQCMKDILTYIIKNGNFDSGNPLIEINIYKMKKHFESLYNKEEISESISTLMNIMSDMNND